MQALLPGKVSSPLKGDLEESLHNTYLEENNEMYCVNNVWGRLMQYEVAPREGAV